LQVLSSYVRQADLLELPASRGSTSALIDASKGALKSGVWSW
jgi:hypothetical protein